MKEIQVIRSDTAPASNYVICSRICQQMQIADIVVVDVSAQNANVFYEFGMAIALGKLILPICYSESFFKMAVPPKIKDMPDLIKHVEHSIGCYPWQKDLFEFYGIRYKYKKPEFQIGYEEFARAADTKYGFSDINCLRFSNQEPLLDGDEIGEQVYKRLRKEYNSAEYEQNTLVVYTMDAFLNEEQAGLCIVNFYHGITARMRQERCFCGERIGVLVQENTAWEEEKDAKGQLDLSYSVGGIIQIGLNQATYLAMRDRIVARDSLVKNQEDSLSQEHRNEIERFIKGHVRNKGIRVYPNYPVLIDRMKNPLLGDILEPVGMDPACNCVCCNSNFFCLYHVMLRTLRYTNEVVVDISDNCLQTLFWLGVAHGSDVHAITVMHEKTNDEKRNSSPQEQRYIFDVAGLWTAIFRKNDTEGFYQQLALAQHGIERQSKLMLSDSEIYKYKSELDEYFSSFNGEHKEKALKSLEEQKAAREETVLESYYRTHFWLPMLNYNRLSIYISHKNVAADNGEPKVNTSKWDFDAISEISNYLSKRKIIGQYRLTTLDMTEAAKTPVNGAKETNFICVGSLVSPLDTEKPQVPNYIAQKIPKSFKIHRWCSIDVKQLYIEGNLQAQIKGFSCINDEDKGYYTHVPQTQLKEYYKAHPANEATDPKIIYSVQAAQNSDFALDIDGTHYEIAQLVLWREDVKTPFDHSHYWVSIAGSSGPATLALSTVFIDEDQRRQVFSAPSKNSVNLLCELQAEVRKQFMEYFRKNLAGRMERIVHQCIGDHEDPDKEGKIDAYFKLVEYAVSFYLQTVLYRYFFPFLTPNDIERIRNGMYTMLNSMKAAKVSPFALVTAIRDDGINTSIPRNIAERLVKQIPEVLVSSLQNFKGLEAFYLVKVQHRLEDRDKDTRRIESIEMMKQGNNASSPQIVNCYMLAFD